MSVDQTQNRPVPDQSASADIFELFWPAHYGDDELILDQLAARRGRRIIIDALSFRVPAGSTLHVAGANGAGKTTLLRCLAGLLPLSAGGAIYRADDLAPTHVHELGHRDGLKSRLSVLENLSAMAAIMGAPGLTRAGLEKIVTHLGLVWHQNRPINELSAGQRRRAALARLLVAPRPVWLLDEPLTALDQSARLFLQTMIDHHVKRGGIAIISSHEPLPFADHQLVLTPPQGPPVSRKAKDRAKERR